MIHLAHFEVMGVPAPQGSHTAINRGNRAVVIDGSSKTGRAKHKAWRGAVADIARQVADPEPFDGALSLLIGFRMPMPTSRPARAREVGVWPHTVKPDIDKLIRCTLDGLTDGGLIRDDARVFKLDVFAMEVIGWTGADITLQRWEA